MDEGRCIMEGEREGASGVFVRPVER